MIRTQELVPDYYIESSRDFQVLCRLLDYLYNSTKYNSESLLNATDTERSKNTILPLIGDKFGIYDKDSYSTREMLDALPSALAYKGSMHSALTLIHSFLDSMDVFDYAAVYKATNEKSATEISEILRRPIAPYTLVIVLSSYPNLTKLRILDTYLKMVIPTGMYIEYVFGYNKKILDVYKYKDFVVLYYTREEYMLFEDIAHQTTSVVKGKDDVFTYNVSPISTLNDTEKQFVIDRATEDVELVHAVGVASIEQSKIKVNTPDTPEGGDDEEQEDVARTDVSLTDTAHIG